MLGKVQQDPVGMRIVHSAMQECVIEDQAAMIQALKKELLAKNHHSDSVNE